MEFTHDLANTMTTWHWSINLSLVIFVTLILSRVIAWACDHFEPAAGHLGRNWPDGIKGRTINAAGSSMPELCTTIALLFLVGGATGAAYLGAGISVTAGSAVFNGVIIPAAVIFAVLAPLWIRLMTFGIAKAMTKQADTFTIDKKTVATDMLFVFIAELALILFLHKGVFELWMCFALLGIYALYTAVSFFAVRNHDGEDVEAEEGWTNKRALWSLLWSTAVLVVTCYILGEVIIISATALGVHPIITAVFFGAAASSVPDTILSVRDARNGDYEDALANAFGSNTFDICVALAGPMAVYIFLNGPITIPDHQAIEILRVGLLVTTVMVGAMLLWAKNVKAWMGIVLLFTYLLWTFFVLDTEFGLLFFSGS